MSDDALARRAVAERVAPFGDFTVGDEERGVVEELAREVEEQIEQRLAIVRLFELFVRGVRRERAAMARHRTHRVARRLHERRLRLGPFAGRSTRRRGHLDRRRRRFDDGRLDGRAEPGLRDVPRTRDRRGGDLRHGRRRLLQLRSARRLFSILRRERRARGGDAIRRAQTKRRNRRRARAGRLARNPRRGRRAFGLLRELRDEPLHAPIERHAVRAEERLAYADVERDAYVDAQATHGAGELRRVLGAERLRRGEDDALRV